MPVGLLGAARGMKTDQLFMRCERFCGDACAAPGQRLLALSGERSRVDEDGSWD